MYYVWVTKWFLAVLGMTATAAVISTSSAGAGPGPNGLARTPPMGWMSWQVFRCETDCVKYPDACIDEQLYTDMADTLASDGYLQAGYSSVSIDDCWEVWIACYCSMFLSCAIALGTALVVSCAHFPCAMLILEMFLQMLQKNMRNWGVPDWIL